MQWLANISVRRAVFASVLMLAIFVVGAASYRSLGVDFFPKIDFPIVSVITRLDGAAPKEVEIEVSDKIEAAVNTISGIDELRSVSSEGVSQVYITFQLSKDGDVAAQEVRDHVSRALPDLPKGIDQPIIQKLDPDASPIMYLALEGSQPIREITEIADKQVRRDLENISGVGQVSVVGGRKRQINVMINTEALRGFGLTAGDVQRAIASQNLAAPGGRVETGPRDLTLRVKGRVESPAALKRIVIQQRGARPIRLQDVARVEDSAADAETTAAIDDTPVLILSIRKQSGENTVAVAKAVRERVAAIEKNLPSGYRIRVVRDGSTSIQHQVDAVKEHLVLGALFAACVVLLFLGSLRSTVIAAIAIPVSIVGTFALMAAQGFTLNMITLLALALAVGIVIDDAIVVLENIFRFIHEKGLKPFPAAIAATKDVGMAVLATTLSLMAVFLPIAFMSGMVGRIMHSFGLTMAFAIGVSLVVAFTVTPMLASRWLNPPTARKQTTVLERLVDRFYRPIERVYMATLSWSMRHRWIIVLACFAAVGSIVPLAAIIPKGFMPANDEANFEINIRTPEGTSLPSTMIVAQRIARETRRFPGVNYTLTSIGDNEQRSPNVAKIYVKLVDPKNRSTSQQDLVARVRKELVARLPKEFRTDVSDVSAFSGGGMSSKTVQYYVSGPSIERLSEISTNVLGKLSKVPGAIDVDSSLVMGKPEVQLEVLRDRAADLGVQVADISTAAQMMVGGLKVSTYEENGESYDIRLRAESEDRTNVERLGVLTVPSSNRESITLRDVVRFQRSEGPSEINRVNRRRQVTLSANLLPGHGESEVLSALEKIVQEEHLPSGFSGKPAGRSRQTGQAVGDFLVAFSLAFIFMYLVLAAQFDSWLHPLTILLTLPLTIPFALLSLVIFDQSLNIQSALGLLVLFGVVKKNAILQVDHTNNLRAEGMPREQAILTANRDRLRPILMTTIAFVAGMVPLATANGIGAGMSRATAGVIVGGQVLSLVLTLLATPVVYSLFDDAAQWLGRRFGKYSAVDRGQRETEVAQRAPVALALSSDPVQLADQAGRREV
jgi:hydrophobic/amphiphilic exporter-1 (mainly G- bacteria), HAE1 family